MRARSLRESLPAICKAVTGEMGINLVFQGPPRTDGRTIYSNPLPIEASEDEIDIIVGDIDHECAHIRYTDFEFLERELLNIEPEKQNIMQALHNGTEDPMIERRLGEDYLGCVHTLARSVELLEENSQLEDFSSMSPAKMLAGYIDSWGRVNVLGQRVEKTLEAATAAVTEYLGRKGVIKLNALLSTRLFSANTSQETWGLAKAVLQLVEEIDEEQKKPPEQPKGGKGGDGDDSNGGPSQGAGGDSGTGGEQQPSPGQGGDSGAGGGEPQAGDKGNAPGQSTPQNGAADGRGAGKGAGDILADTDVDPKALFDRRPAAQQAAREATRRGNFVGGGYSTRVRRGSDNEAVYAALKDQIGGEIQKLQRTIVAEFQTLTRRRRVVSDSGRLDSRRLVRGILGDNRIYRNRTKVQLPFPAVSVVADCSGSMGKGSAIQLASQALIAVAEVNEYLSIKTELVGFEGGGAEVIKQFDEPLVRARGKIGSLRPAGGTPTAEALWEAGTRLAARKEERKLILLVTDGEPNDMSAAKQVAEMLTASGIEVYGIGIGTDAVRDFCPAHGVIHSPADIAQAVLGALRERILRAAA